MTPTDRPLTIAMMLESDGPGGAENVLYDLATAIRERGHTVYPIGPSNGVGWLGERLRASGFETQTFELRRMIDWGCVRRLTAMIRRLGIDVVHGHEFDGALYGTAAARLARRGAVTTMHGNQTMTAAWRRRAALRWTFRANHAATTVSQETKRQLDADLGLRPSAVSVVHNGVPCRIGSPDAVHSELGIREGELLILAVGNLIPRKGHIFLLRAIHSLEEAGLRVPWRIAIAGGGGGEERPRLEAFIAASGLAERVHVLLGRDDVPDLLAAADLFVMPSLWEGLPLAVLEAMHTGVPVIASRVSGIPEAIVNERHGLLVPPGDPDALARALRRLLCDPGLRERLGAAGRARAEEEFSIDGMAGAYEKLYRGACSAAARGSRV